MHCRDRERNKDRRLSHDCKLCGCRRSGTRQNQIGGCESEMHLVDEGRSIEVPLLLLSTRIARACLPDHLHATRQKILHYTIERSVDRSCSERTTGRQQSRPILVEAEVLARLLAVHIFDESSPHRIAAYVQAGLLSGDTSQRLYCLVEGDMDLSCPRRELAGDETRKRIRLHQHYWHSHHCADHAGRVADVGSSADYSMRTEATNQPGHLQE